MEDKFRQTVEQLFSLAQKYESTPSWALGLKLSEETGELSEVLLHDLGYKDPNSFEPLIEEAADCFNVIVAILAKQYPDRHPRQLTLEFLDAINKKGGKYSKVVGAQDEYFTEEVEKYYND